MTLLSARIQILKTPIMLMILDVSQINTIVPVVLIETAVTSMIAPKKITMNNIFLCPEVNKTLSVFVTL